MAISLTANAFCGNRFRENRTAAAPDVERPHPEGDRAGPLYPGLPDYLSSFSSIQLPTASMSSAGMARV